MGNLASALNEHSIGEQIASGGPQNIWFFLIFPFPIFLTFSFLINLINLGKSMMRKEEQQMKM